MNNSDTYMNTKAKRIANSYGYDMLLLEFIEISKLSSNIVDWIDIYYTAIDVDNVNVLKWFKKEEDKFLMESSTFDTTSYEDQINSTRFQEFCRFMIAYTKIRNNTKCTE